MLFGVLTSFLLGVAFYSAGIGLALIVFLSVLAGVVGTRPDHITRESQVGALHRLTFETLIDSKRHYDIMTQATSRPALFVGAMISGVVALTVLFLTDFGGWYNYYYYSGTSVWSYIGVNSPISLVGIAVVCIPLFFALSVSFKGAQNPDSLTMQQVNRALMASVIQLVLILVAGVVFVVAVSGSDDWWFGIGFYGSVIGVFMMMIFLRMAKQQYAAHVPQGFTPYGLPTPMHIQSGVQPYTTPSAYTAPPPRPQWQTGPVGSAPPGQPPSSRFCSKCGHLLATGAMFCERCGARIQ